MKKVLEFINYDIYKNIYLSILIIILGIIVYLLFKKILLKIINNGNNKKLDKRKLTYFKLLKNILKYVFLLLIVTFILNLNGVNVTSIIAGLGVVSVIAGLALQDALKDIIMGLNIIVDEYFVVGDILKIGDTEGKVLEIGLKVTKLKDINNDNILIIANRNISEALNLSGIIDIDIPLRYEDKLDKIENIVNIIIKEIKKLDEINNCEYKGICDFGDSAIYYKIRLYTNPETKKKIANESRRIIKRILDENNIEIPYNQLDIHNK